MKAINVIRKFITVLTCSMLVVTQVSFAETTEAQAKAKEAADAAYAKTAAKKAADEAVAKAAAKKAGDEAYSKAIAKNASDTAYAKAQAKLASDEAYSEAVAKNKLYNKEEGERFDSPGTPAVKALEGETSNEANYCLEDPAQKPKIESCKEKRMQFNCHLQRCVAPDDNELYNDEYNDCNKTTVEADKASCKENLKTVANSIDGHDANMADNTKFAKDNKSHSMMSNAGVAVDAGMTIYLGMIALGPLTLPDCISGGISLGVSALSLMYKMSTRDKYKQKFKAAISMMNNIDKKDKKGWNHNTQIATLDMEIKALELIKEAAEEKMKYHKTLKTMSSVVLGIATTEAIVCSLVYSGCPQNVACAVRTAVFSAAGLALEIQAYNGVKEKRNDANTALTQAKEIRVKLQGLYNVDSDSMSFSNPQLAMGANGQLQMAQVNTNNGDQNEVDGSQVGSGSCLAEDGAIGSCPCEGDSCQTFDFNLPGNSGLEASVAKRMNYAGYEKGMNSAASGNINDLDFASSDKNFALSSKVNNRLLKKALGTKSLTPKQKASFQKIKDGFESRGEIAKTVGFGSPMRLALLSNKFSGANEGLDPIGKASSSAVLSDKSKKKSKAIYSKGGAGLTALQKRLQALKDSLNMDENGIKVGSNGNVFGEEKGLLDKGLGAENLQTEADIDSVHPDEKISIFKIISNRYNVLRVRKRFAK